MNYEELAAILIISVTAAIIAIYWVKSRSTDPEIWGKRMKLEKQYTKELEYELDSYVKELKQYKGKLARQKGSVTIPESVSLDSADGIGSAIKELLPQIAPFLPKQAQQFLNDPKLVDYGIELYKKDPEKAKQILSGFIKKGGRPKSTISQGSGNQVSEIPDFGADGQVL